MSGIYGRLLNALVERGHTQEQIAKMSPRKAVAEYAAWHLGNAEWGRDFYDLVHNADAVLPGERP